MNSFFNSPTAGMPVLMILAHQSLGESFSWQDEGQEK